MTSLGRQLAELAEKDERHIKAGHLELGPDIWLSCDPDGQGEMTCRPGPDGFELQLEHGDSGAWACLGMRFGASALTGMRYLGLLLAMRGRDMVSLTPTLRYFHNGGVRDVPTASPVTLAGGAREYLAHIPVDAEELARATSCELNLFFLRDAFTGTFEKIEPLRIL